MPSVWVWQYLGSVQVPKVGIVVGGCGVECWCALGEGATGERVLEVAQVGRVARLELQV